MTTTTKDISLEDVKAKLGNYDLRFDLKKPDSVGQGFSYYCDHTAMDIAKGPLVAVLGPFNAGKSWFCNKLFNQDFVSSLHAHTEGICLKKVVAGNRDLVIVDTAGHGQSIVLFEQSAFKSAPMSVAELSKELDMQYVQVQRATRDKIEEQHAQELFVKQVVFDAADFFVFVVNHISSSDQLMIEAFVQNLKQKKKNQLLEVFIVHNFQDATNFEECKEVWKEIVDSYPLLMASSEYNALYEYPVPTMTNEGTGQRHFFLCSESKAIKGNDASSVQTESALQAIKKHNNATLDSMKSIIARKSLSSQHILDRVDAFRVSIEKIIRNTCYVSVNGKEDRLVNEQIKVSKVEKLKSENLSHGLIKIDGDDKTVGIFEDFVNRLEFGPAQFQGDASMDQCFDFPIQAYVSDTSNGKYFVLDIVAGFVPIDIVPEEDGDLSLEDLLSADSPLAAPTNPFGTLHKQVFSVVFEGKYLKISASSESIKLEMTRSFAGQEPPFFFKDVLTSTKISAIPRQVQFNTNVQTKDIVFSEFPELKKLDIQLDSKTTKVTASQDGVIRVKIRLPVA